MKSHSIRAIAVVIWLLVFFVAGTTHAQEHDPSVPQRGPSTAEERARAVKIAHDLEENPLAEDSKDQRAWVIRWIIEIPDITVDVCMDYFGTLPDPHHGHSAEIAGQMIISSAAFMIEHPDKAKNEQAVALSGLLGSLKAYQAILKQDSDSRWPYVDKLVQMRDQGKLDDFVTETRRKCAEDQEKPDPDRMRTQAIIPPNWMMGTSGN